MNNVQEKALITQTLVMMSKERNEEIVTSLVMDEGSFNIIWYELLKLPLTNQIDGEAPDFELLAKIRKAKRIPLVARTENTKNLFEVLQVKTEKFCGIVRGEGKNKMDLGG